MPLTGKELTDNVCNMKLEYEFAPSQEAKIIAWQSKLPSRFTGAMGGRFRYSLTPTDFGPIVKVKDQVTGEEIDVTEYEEWTDKKTVKPRKDLIIS